jgi:hypothetical protein
LDECVMCECVCVTLSARRRAMACRWRVMVDDVRREARRQQRRRAWPRGRTRGAARRPRVRARGVQCASCASAAEPGAVWWPAGACGRCASDCSECERVRVMHVWTRCAQRRRCRVGHVAEPPTVGRGMRTARRANVEGSTRGPPAVRLSTATTASGAAWERATLCAVVGRTSARGSSCARLCAEAARGGGTMRRVCAWVTAVRGGVAVAIRTRTATRDGWTWGPHRGRGPRGVVVRRCGRVGGRRRDA